MTHVSDDSKKRLGLFLKKVAKTSSCWVWTGSKNNKGYGVFKHKNGTYAHRYSYLIFNKALPKKICVCHKCDNPSCVNPKHLFLGTQKENLFDCLKKGRLKVFGKPVSPTHCPQGHSKNDQNTSFHKRTDGTYGKECKACLKIRGKLFRSTKEYRKKHAKYCRDRYARIKERDKDKPKPIDKRKLLTEFTVKEIRALYIKSSLSQKEIGEMYGVTRAAICDVVLRRSWAHIKDDENEKPTTFQAKRDSCL